MFFPSVYLSRSASLVTHFQALAWFLVFCLIFLLFSTLLYSLIFYPRFSTMELMAMPHRSQHKSDLIWGLLASAASHLTILLWLLLPLPTLYALIVLNYLCFLCLWSCSALYLEFPSVLLHLISFTYPSRFTSSGKFHDNAPLPLSACLFLGLAG